jgi:FkbM family methyltransferase
MIIPKHFLKSIQQSVKSNGWILTLNIFLFYLRFSRSSRLHLSFYFSALNKTLFFRPATSDFSVFRQIFMDYEYSIEFEHSPRTIIDAGANVGFASLYFSNRFPGAQIIAVEPDHSNFDTLLSNIQGNENVTALKAALWNSTCTLSFVEDNTLDKWGIQVTDSGMSGASTIHGIDVGTIMRDFNLERIDVFKIDIEGAEMELFTSGFAEWLPKTKLLIVELHESLRPGCKQVFYDALKIIPHTISYYGENVVVRNLLT